MLCNDEYMIQWMDYRGIDYFGNMVPTLKNFSQIEWLEQQTAIWNSYYQPEFIEILTPRGYGFVFNMLDPTKMFHET